MSYRKIVEVDVSIAGGAYEAGSGKKDDDPRLPVIKIHPSSAIQDEVYTPILLESKGYYYDSVQWYKDDIAIPDATELNYTVDSTNILLFSEGEYTAGVYKDTPYWFKEGKRIPDSDKLPFPEDISGVFAALPVTYTVVYTNEVGSVTSSPAVILPRAVVPPVITLQPQDYFAQIFENNITLVSEGERYSGTEWEKLLSDGITWMPIPDSNSTRYSLESRYDGNPEEFRVRYFHHADEVYSDPAKVSGTYLVWLFGEGLSESFKDVVALNEGVLTTTRTTEASFVDSNGVIRYAPVDTIRYETVSDKTMALLETETENRLLDSTPTQGGTTWEFVDGGTELVDNTKFVAGGSILAPDESNVDIQVQFFGTHRNHRIRPIGYDKTTVAGQPYTFSFYIKESGTTEYNVDFVLGSIVGGVEKERTLGVKTYLDEWTRIELTVEETNGQDLDFFIRRESYDESDNTYAFWGAQLEANEVATSVIPTAGSPVTRGGDKVSFQFDGNSPMPNTADTHLVTYHTLSDTKVLKKLYNVPNINKQTLYTQTTEGGAAVSSGEDDKVMLGKDLPSDTVRTLAMVNSGDMTKGYVDGIEGGSSVSKVLGDPTGQQVSLGEDFNGHIRDFLIFKYALTTPQLGVVHELITGQPVKEKPSLPPQTRWVYNFGTNVDEFANEAVWLVDPIYLNRAEDSVELTLEYFPNGENQVFLDGRDGPPAIEDDTFGWVEVLADNTISFIDGGYAKCYIDGVDAIDKTTVVSVGQHRIRLEPTLGNDNLRVKYVGGCRTYGLPFKGRLYNLRVTHAGGIQYLPINDGPDQTRILEVDSPSAIITNPDFAGGLSDGWVVDEPALWTFDDEGAHYEGTVETATITYNQLFKRGTNLKYTVRGDKGTITINSDAAPYSFYTSKSVSIREDHVDTDFSIDSFVGVNIAFRHGAPNGEEVKFTVKSIQTDGGINTNHRPFDMLAEGWEQVECGLRYTFGTAPTDEVFKPQNVSLVTGDEVKFSVGPITQNGLEQTLVGGTTGFRFGQNAAGTWWIEGCTVKIDGNGISNGGAITTFGEVHQVKLTLTMDVPDISFGSNSDTPIWDVDMGDYYYPVDDHTTRGSFLRDARSPKVFEHLGQAWDYNFNGIGYVQLVPQWEGKATTPPPTGDSQTVVECYVRRDADSAANQYIWSGVHSVTGVEWAVWCNPAGELVSSHSIRLDGAVVDPLTPPVMEIGKWHRVSTRGEYASHCAVSHLGSYIDGTGQWTGRIKELANSDHASNSDGHSNWSIFPLTQVADREPTTPTSPDNWGEGYAEAINMEPAWVMETQADETLADAEEMINCGWEYFPIDRLLSGGSYQFGTTQKEIIRIPDVYLEEGDTVSFMVELGDMTTHGKYRIPFDGRPPAGAQVVTDHYGFIEIKNNMVQQRERTGWSKVEVDGVELLEGELIPQTPVRLTFTSAGDSDLRRIRYIAGSKFAAVKYIDFPLWDIQIMSKAVGFINYPLNDGPHLYPRIRDIGSNRAHGLATDFDPDAWQGILKIPDETAWLFKDGVDAAILDSGSFSFSRATEGTYIENDTIMTAPVDTLRYEDVNGLKMALIEGPSENLFLNASVPSVQTFSLPSSKYAISCRGQGYVEVTGAAIGSTPFYIATPEDPIVVETIEGDLVVTPVGVLEYVQVEALHVASSYIPTPVTGFTSRASEGYIFDSTGKYVSVPVDTERLTYDPSDLTKAPTSLCESAADNLCFDTNISQVWKTSGNGILPNGWNANGFYYPIVREYTPNPFGDFALHCMESGIPNDNAKINGYGVLGFEEDTSYVYTVYAKAAERNRIRTWAFKGNDRLALFDLENGRVVATKDVDHAWIEDMGDGWYACSSTFHIDTGSAPSTTNLQFSPYLSDYEGDVGSGSRYDGTYGHGILVAGVQLHKGTQSQSYIPNPAVFLSRASTATYVDSTGALMEAAVDTARVSYNPNDLTQPPMDLYETDKVQGMQTFDAWDGLAADVAITLGEADPLGGTTGCKVCPTATGTVKAWFQDGDWATSPTNVGGHITYSCFLKWDGDADAKFVSFGNAFAASNGGAWGSLTVDLENGTIVSSHQDNLESRIEPYAGGWYRVWVSVLIPAAPTSKLQGVSLKFTDASGTPNTVISWGDGLKGVYCALPQIEKDQLTSFINSPAGTREIDLLDVTTPVSRAADIYTSDPVSRAADMPSIQASGNLDPDKAGSIHTRMKVAKPSVSDIHTLYQVGDSQVAPSDYRGYVEPEHIVHHRGGDTLTKLGEAATEADFTRLLVSTCSIGLSDGYSYINMNLTDTDILNTASHVPVGDTIRIGHLDDGASPFYGHISDFRVFPDQLEQTQLLELEYYKDEPVQEPVQKPDKEPVCKEEPVKKPRKPRKPRKKKSEE